jgi:hypothetical protein
VAEIDGMSSCGEVDDKKGATPLVTVRFEPVAQGMSEVDLLGRVVGINVVEHRQLGYVRR